MAFDELKDHLSEADASVRSYLDSSREYYKLRAFKFIMQGVAAFTKVLLIGTVALLTLLFLSFAAAYGLGILIGNLFYGFLIIGLFYLLVGIVLYLLRQKLNKPILAKFSDFYFDEL